MARFLSIAMRWTGSITLIILIIVPVAFALSKNSLNQNSESLNQNTLQTKKSLESLPSKKPKVRVDAPTPSWLPKRVKENIYEKKKSE